MKWKIVKKFIFWFVLFFLWEYLFGKYSKTKFVKIRVFCFLAWTFPNFRTAPHRYYTRKTQVLWYYPLSATSCYKSIPSFPNYPYVWWLRSCNPLTPWWQKHWRWRARWWITASTFHRGRPRGCWRRGGRRRSLNHCQGHTLVGCNKKKTFVILTNHIFYLFLTWLLY